MNLLDNETYILNNAQIIADFRLGNSSSMVHCYKQIVPYITLFLRSHNMTHANADELAWTSIEGFRRNCVKPDFDLIDREGKPIPYLKYLKGIAKNICLEKREEMTKRQTEVLYPSQQIKEDGEQQPSPFNRADSNTNDTEFNQTVAEALQLTEQLIANLPAKCHQIIRLSCYDDVPYTRIAAQLDTNESALRKRLFDCRRMLLQALKSSQYTDLFKDIDFMKKYLLP